MRGQGCSGYIKALADLTQKGVTRVAIANPASVPVGRYSEGALKKAFVDHKDDLVFLDILTHKGANVFPMVAAGKGLSEMILADEEL